MKIIFASNMTHDGCNFYRGMGPWASMVREQNPGVDIYVSGNMPSWVELRMSDLLVLQRPSGEKALQAAMEAKAYDIPIWVDYDDNLFELPKDNPGTSLYQSRLPSMEGMLKLATVVTVSTNALREQWLSRFQKLELDIEVIPNALDPMLEKFKANEPSEKHVLWRGTATHQRDVASVAPQLVEISARFPDHKFIFLGSNPYSWGLSELMKNAIVIDVPMDPVTFYKAMCALKPRVIVCPLADSDFCRAKSNIAAIEGALAGAACLAPDWDSWNLPGVTHYRTPENFRSQLFKLLSGELNAAALAEETWQHVSKNLTLRQTNNMRLDLARRLCGKS